MVGEMNDSVEKMRSTFSAVWCQPKMRVCADLSITGTPTVLEEDSATHRRTNCKASSIHSCVAHSQYRHSARKPVGVGNKSNNDAYNNMLFSNSIHAQEPSRNRPTLTNNIYYKTNCTMEVSTETFKEGILMMPIWIKLKK